jgi:hypothetical protein
MILTLFLLCLSFDGLVFGMESNSLGSVLKHVVDLIGPISCQSLVGGGLVRYARTTRGIGGLQKKNHHVAAA